MRFISLSSSRSLRESQLGSIRSISIRSSVPFVRRFVRHFWANAPDTEITPTTDAIASVVGVISVSGAFAQKWRTNRLTKGTLERIEIDLMDPNCDSRKLLEELNEMKRIHHLAIAGESDESRSGQRITPARDPPNPT